MTSLSTKLAEREASGNPIQVGIIGAGKFGSMFICQSHRSPGIRLAAIADLSKDRALAALKRTGYPTDRVDANGEMSIGQGIKAGKTVITTDSAELIATPGIDVIVEVTGSPAAGVRHALLVSCPDVNGGSRSTDVELVLRTQETHRNGQRRSRCSCWSSARQESSRSWHNLFNGVWRSTSNHFRTC